MSGEWVRDDSDLTVADIERRQPYRMQPHDFKARRWFPYLVCRHCGLVRLHNRLTAWADRMGCNAEDRPGWASQLRAAKEVSS